MILHTVSCPVVDVARWHSKSRPLIDDSQAPSNWTKWATQALHLALQSCVSRHQRTFNPRIGGHRRRDNGGAVDQRAQLQELRYNYPTSTPNRRLNVVNHACRAWDADIYLTCSWISSIPFFIRPRSYHRTIIRTPLTLSEM